MSELMTDSGIEVEAIYRAQDAPTSPPDPGQYPWNILSKEHILLAMHLD